MSRVPVVVIGAGHAGLAMSYQLSGRSVDHVVLERGRVAESWRTQRWDSLRLLTPNWQTRLPGFAYDGDDPDGFMTMSEVIEFIESYASVVDAPVETGVEVASVARNEDGYRVASGDRAWNADAVVLATGGFNQPKIPELAAGIPVSINQVTPPQYKRPDQLAAGRVLVVGASATGVQIADEVQRSGREVTLAVGEHVRLPRSYRGRDILWWMDRIGRFDERYDQVDDIVRARHVASPQLVGTPERATVDLNHLTAAGVRLVGRLGSVSDGRAFFSGALRNTVRLADLKLNRLLNEIDDWVTEQGLLVEEPERFASTEVEEEPGLVIDLVGEGFETVIWATGFRPDYGWLDIPVLDRKGEIRHEGGIVPDAPGLYRLGLNFLRRRKSSFIHGASDDTRDIADHLLAHLDRTRTLARSG